MGIDCLCERQAVVASIGPKFFKQNGQAQSLAGLATPGHSVDYVKNSQYTFDCLFQCINHKINLEQVIKCVYRIHILFFAT